jgi:DNA polymerase-3 subunit epsilon
MLSQNEEYKRINNVIYKGGDPFIKLQSTFIDLDFFRPEAITYMNSYLKMYPDKFEIIKSMNRIIKMFYDLETTGVNVKIHGVHQISGCIEIDGEVVETFNFKVRPNPKAKIEPEALQVGGVTEDQIMQYEEMRSVYVKVVDMLAKYVDRFNPKEKIWLVGFNNRSFDDVFFRSWFEQNKDSFFGAWFWSDSLDVLVLASQYLLNRRTSMQTFKLKRVALELGIPVDESKLHDAAYDIQLTREIYRIVTGIEIEI